MRNLQVDSRESGHLRVKMPFMTLHDLKESLKQKTFWDALIFIRHIRLVEEGSGLMKALGLWKRTAATSPEARNH